MGEINEVQNLYNNDSSKYIHGIHNNEKKKIDLELETANLRMMIHLLESKNRILEENCFLLKDKTLDYQKRLLQIESKSLVEDENEESTLIEDSDEENNNSENQNLQKVRDGLGGAIFGVFLPKVANLIGKIHKKQIEVKEFLQEHGEGMDKIDCPAEKMKCKDHVLNLLKKVNVFRVVTVVGTLLLVSGAGYFAYKTWKSQKLSIITDGKTVTNKRLSKKSKKVQNN